MSATGQKRGEGLTTFAGAVAATGFAALLARACPAGCATCSTCAVSVLPTAALVGSVGVAAVGSRLKRRAHEGSERKP